MNSSTEVDHLVHHLEGTMQPCLCANPVVVAQGCFELSVARLRSWTKQLGSQHISTAVGVVCWHLIYHSKNHSKPKQLPVEP